VITTSWQQMSGALLLALLLHGGIAFWLTLPTPERPLLPPPEQPLRVSLSAMVAESTTAAAPVEPPPPKPQPKPKPAPQPEPKPVLEPPPMVQKPALKPQAEAEPKPEPEPEPPEQRPEIVEAPTPLQEPAPVTPSPAPLDAVATARYEQLLVAWLEKHKQYPRRAKRMRIEGEGQLRILIDRTGQTQKITLEKPTGNRLLDQAALNMAKRANPFPPMPNNDPRKTLEFIVPVVFALR